eukprot:TRINITY_DN27747_c0_g1_i3.p1 TRINITY_DN27747_c0_g1~~TRINITY_DN27747_c0_g1_i3.p1  ORF type:complete len:323 (+),score=66.82 TRINITY_DN27747_c0_g1_i3:287-1255(+)
MASTTRALCTILALTAAFALASKEPTCQSSDGGCDAVPISPNVPDLRGKFPSTVRPEHKSWNPLGVTPKEWEARTEIAAVYRGLHLYGLGEDLAAQCVMLRHPEHTDRFLLAEWGFYFEEVTASSMLVYDFNGDVYGTNGSSRGPATSRDSNMGCLPVAAAIFKARPDVKMVIHIHPPAVMAVAGLKAGLLPVSQAEFFLHGQISREPYDFSYETDFETVLAAGFSHGKRAMLLNHHGMYAVGRDSAEAFFTAFYLNQACEVQVRTMSMAGGDMAKVEWVPEEVLKLQYKDMMLSPDYAYDGSREWPGLVRKVMRQHADLNM